MIMNVAELITELQKHPADLPIMGYKYGMLTLLGEKPEIEEIKVHINDNDGITRIFDDDDHGADAGTRVLLLTFLE